MIRISLRLAVGALGIGAGATAFALPPAQWTPAAPTLNVYVGGATATDNVLENSLISSAAGICQDNGNAADPGIDIFRITTSNQGQRVIFCDVRAGVAGIAVGTDLAFHKESIGGSSNGVTPIARSVAIPFFNMAQAVNCVRGATPVTVAGNLPYWQWDCNGIAAGLKHVNQVPNGGLADVEAQLAFDALNSQEIARLNVARGVHIVFGVPVNVALYRALQAAQEDTLPLNNPAGTCAGIEDTLPCVPTLSSSQIRGIYAGRLTNWDQLLGPAGGLAATAATPPVNAAGTIANNAIFICRRVGSSGTQASYETYWLNQRCDAIRGSTASPSFIAPNDGSTDTVGAPPAANVGRVNASEGSGDVRACINFHQTNGTWAIGTLSTEVTGGQLTNIRMVRVDGAAPNLASVANGDYDFFTESVLHRLNTPFGGVNPPAGDVLDILLRLEDQIPRAANIAAINTGFQGRPWGDGGALGIQGFLGNVSNVGLQANGAAGAGTVRANPVNTQSRSLLTNRTNNCYPPVTIRPSPVTGAP